MQVISFNVWGIGLGISKRRKERMQAIATVLRATKADIVLLQEVWVDGDAKDLQTAAKAGGLVHAVHFRSGMFGSGLITLSRHPITQMGFFRYGAGGNSMDVHHGDFHAGKGVGWVRLETPNGPVDVLNTHTHANYSHVFLPPPPAVRRNPLMDKDALVPRDGGDAATRIAQMIELAQVASVIAGVPPGSAAPGARPMILGGDLNCKPGTIEFNLLKQMVPWLKDCWLVADEKAASPDNPEGLTCRAPGNTFASYKQVPERIDFIWSDLPCSKAGVDLTHKTASGCSLSDHFAVSATLRLDGAARQGGKAAAAGTAPAVAAGLSEATGRTALFGSAALLEETILASGADSSLKTAIGGGMVVAVLYCAAALPFFMPWMYLGGWRLSLALVAAGLLAGVGLLVLLAGRVGDLAQQRALANAYKQLRMFVDAHGVTFMPEDTAAAEPAPPMAVPL